PMPRRLFDAGPRRSGPVSGKRPPSKRGDARTLSAPPPDHPPAPPSPEGGRRSGTLAKCAWRAGYCGLACIIAVCWDTQFSPVDARTLCARHKAQDNGRLFLIVKRMAGQDRTGTNWHSLEKSGAPGYDLSRNARGRSVSRCGAVPAGNEPGAKYQLSTPIEYQLAAIVIIK